MGKNCTNYTSVFQLSNQFTCPNRYPCINEVYDKVAKNNTQYEKVRKYNYGSLEGGEKNITKLRQWMKGSARKGLFSSGKKLRTY